MKYNHNVDNPEDIALQKEVTPQNIPGQWSVRLKYIVKNGHVCRLETCL